MNIPEGIGWTDIKSRLNKLNIKGIDHISFGFPEETISENKKSIRDFYDGMSSILEVEQLVKNKETERFLYYNPKEKRLGYEHLLWPRNEVFFHIEIACENSSDEILSIFPEAFEEQPGMFWVTVDKHFLGMLWAVILNNKKFH